MLVFLSKNVYIFLEQLNREIIFVIFLKNIKQVLHLPTEKCKPRETVLCYSYLNGKLRFEFKKFNICFTAEVSYFFTSLYHLKNERKLIRKKILKSESN